MKVFILKAKTSTQSSPLLKIDSYSLLKQRDPINLIPLNSPQYLSILPQQLLGNQRRKIHFQSSFFAKLQFTKPIIAKNFKKQFECRSKADFIYRKKTFSIFHKYRKNIYRRSQRNTCVLYIPIYIFILLLICTRCTADNKII